MRFDINHKRSVNPYEAMTKIEQVMGLSSTLVTFNKSSFLIEAASKEQVRMIPQIDKIGEFQCKPTKYDIEL